MKLVRNLKSLFSEQPALSVPPVANPPVRQDFDRLENFVWLLNRMPSGVPPALAVSAESATNDLQLVERVRETYKRAISEFQTSFSSWDTVLFDVKADIHNALIGESIDAAAQVLRDPSSNTFFWGFDAIASSPAGEPEPHELVLRRLNKSVDWRELYGIWLCDALISFAEAIGARRSDYPEIEIDHTMAARSAPYNIDAILDEIEAVLGVKLHFPNPYPNEAGLPSKRGIIGFRSIQSAYQGWRIAQLANRNPDFKVMEIGAGLGRTAYFANLFGVTNYTIVDIPLTNAAQGYFLGRVLGESSVELYGEPARGGVRILSSMAMREHNETYDLIVNVDSWTEMAFDVAKMYWDFSRKATNKVLSINHEFNPHPVRQLYKDDPEVRALRYPYPVRRGYVEEILTW